MRQTYNQSNDVENWASEVWGERDKLRAKQDRSEEASRRLGLLSEKLPELHELATNASLEAAARVSTPVEGAESLRELLVQFKGELIRLCKQGSGTKYSRIADNLAFDDPILDGMVRSGQEDYDSLHSELAEIAKHRVEASIDRLRELLGLLEDHVLVITTSLDPDKTGLNFLPIDNAP